MPVIINDLDVVVNEPPPPTGQPTEPHRTPTLVAMDLVRLVEERARRASRVAAD